MSGPNTENYIEFVRQHHAGLRAFIRSLGVLPMWVDDIAQEAFIVAYERLDEFDQERDFGAWVRGIARNLVINERRKDARRKRILADNLTDILVRTSSVPEDVEEEMGDYATAKLAALRECMTHLPEKSRALIQARYEKDEAAPDIADRLQMKAPAVRKALERVREALKKCMDEKLRFVEA
ncbi:MAG: sigma-70 family RNA polymerase sigma factor [Verrucomicrobiae bacterium]|nr:sigma-70 family RNA polymerase sigma factor [Verrucomicrobiae bacterium]MCB1090351.1 sigma-70 family RNA polymerase sigma factor [Verrucomicrobiae bacterium]